MSLFAPDDVLAWHAVAEWRWDTGQGAAAGEQDEDEDVCGICRLPFEACCPACKVPGDDCPLSASNHSLQTPCIRC